MKREAVSKNLSKKTLERANYKCQCCGEGSKETVDILETHYIIPSALGGAQDDESNTMAVCVKCHRAIHMYAKNSLAIDKALYKASFDDLTDKEKEAYESKDAFEKEQNKFKKIVWLGSIIKNMTETDAEEDEN